MRCRRLKLSCWNTGIINIHRFTSWFSCETGLIDSWFFFFSTSSLFHCTILCCMQTAGNEVCNQTVFVSDSWHFICTAALQLMVRSMACLWPYVVVRRLLLATVSVAEKQRKFCRMQFSAVFLTRCQWCSGRRLCYYLLIPETLIDINLCITDLLNYRIQSPRKMNFAYFLSVRPLVVKLQICMHKSF